MLDISHDWLKVWNAAENIWAIFLYCYKNTISSVVYLICVVYMSPAGDRAYTHWYSKQTTYIHT